MTPKEKAIELMNKFSETTFTVQPYAGAYTHKEEIGDEAAKQCALICIKEKTDLIEDMIQIDWRVREIFFLELEEIKIELEKL